MISSFELIENIDVQIVELVKGYLTNQLTRTMVNRLKPFYFSKCLVFRKNNHAHLPNTHLVYENMKKKVKGRATFTDVEIFYCTVQMFINISSDSAIVTCNGTQSGRERSTKRVREEVV